MATIIEKYTANTSWSEAKAGPAKLLLNIEKGFSYISIGTTKPTNDNEAMLLRPVSGENYIEFTLESGDKLYARAVRDDTVLSWISQSVS